MRTDRKFVSHAALASYLEFARSQQMKIVLAAGCFDLIHNGHARYLAAARALGDLLVVGVNADPTVRALKGPTRPLVSHMDRASLLAALETVDLVVVFWEPTPLELIRFVLPDIYAKGGDYTEETLPEASAVRAYGGDVRLLPYDACHSTSKLIARARETGRA